MDIKEAIEVLKIHKDRDDLGSKVYEAIDTVVSAVENPTYTPADMEAFWRWADANGWSYGDLTELWYNDDEELEALKIEDVLKLWEEQK